MFSLLGKYPILCGTALMLVHPTVTFLLWLVWYQTRAFSNNVVYWIGLLMSCAVPLIADLLVALAWRRCGGSPTRLLALVPVAGAASAIAIVAVAMYKGVVVSSYNIQVAFILPTVPALFGLLAGRSIARWLIRSGRWETIMPLNLPR